MKQNVLRMLILLIGASTFLSSCTIRQEYHFNKDLSGEVVTLVDMTMFNEFMNSEEMGGGDEEYSFKDSLDVYFKEAASDLEALDGISDVQYGWKDEINGPFMRYKFRDLESLNRAMNSSGTDASTLGMGSDSGDENHVYFEKKWFFGTKLIYNPPSVDNEELLEGEEMESMGEFYDYEIAFYYEDGIKSIDNENATLSDDSKMVELKGNLFEMVSDSYNSKLEMKLK